MTAFIGRNDGEGDQIIVFDPFVTLFAGVSLAGVSLALRNR